MLLDIQEAVLNLADVMAELWPEDDTPRIITRVLIHFNYGAGLKSSEGDRCRFIVDFCDSLLRDNACRALVMDPPLSFRRAKEKWADLAERQGGQFSSNGVATPASQSSGGNGGGGNANRSRGGGRGG